MIRPYKSYNILNNIQHEKLELFVSRIRPWSSYTCMWSFCISTGPKYLRGSVDSKRSVSIIKLKYDPFTDILAKILGLNID